MNDRQLSATATAVTRITDPNATELQPPSGLRFTVPPPETVASNLSALDTKAGRRTSLLRSLEKSAALDPQGALPGRYEPGAMLGQGGMGVVIQALDRDLARPVALKQLKIDSPSPQFVERFLREAQVTAQLEHPGIVPVHDVGVDESGRFYYIMRL